MQRALAAILCLTVAWHAMLGCCWHHAHTDASADSGHCDHLHVGHSHDAQPHRHDGDRQVPHEPCEKTSCLFVRGEQARTLDQFDELTWSPAISFAPTDFLIESDIMPAPEDGPPPPALARHLQFSVLLI